MAELIKTKISKKSPKFHTNAVLKDIFSKTKVAKMLHFNVANVTVMYIINVVHFQVIKSNYACLSKSGAINAQIV